MLAKLLTLTLLYLTILPSQAKEPDSLLHSGDLRESGLPKDKEVTIPLQSTFYGLVAEIEINAKPVSLILDTGASSTFLTPQTATRLGLTVTKFTGPNVRDIAGSKLKIQQALTQQISLGKAWTKNEPVLITQMPKAVGDGVLGLSTLADWDIRIDPSKMTLILMPAGKSTPAKGSTSLPLQCETVPFTKQGSNPHALRRMNVFVPVKIGDHQIMVTPDTGSGGTLLLPSALLDKHAPEVMEKASPSFTKSLSASGKMSSQSARLPEFSIGPDTLRDLLIDVRTSDSNAPSTLKGTVGLNILRHYVMTFSFSKRELHLQPLGTIEELTSASTAGLNMSRDPSGRFTLLSVTPGSPADKAGMMAGDELLEIEGHPLKNMRKADFMSLKRLAPGTRVKILYKRGQASPVATSLVLIKK